MPPGAGARLDAKLGARVDEGEGKTGRWREYASAGMVPHRMHSTLLAVLVFHYWRNGACIPCGVDGI
jgi:hypothetical protein